MAPRGPIWNCVDTIAFDTPNTKLPRIVYQLGNSDACSVGSEQCYGTAEGVVRGAALSGAIQGSYQRVTITNNRNLFEELARNLQRARGFQSLAL